MRGTILSVGSAQGIILGDDGVRYTFTPAGWREPNGSAQVGMRVDFETRGSHAVGICPRQGSTPPSPSAAVSGQSPSVRVPSTPSPLPPTPGALPAQSLPGAGSGPSPAAAHISGAPTPDQLSGQGAPPAETPTTNRTGFGSKWWHWGLVCGGVAVASIVVVVAFLLGLFGSGSPPEGKEIARHSHEGTTYVLVEYGNELAIFTESGAPVSQPALAEEILRSYAWRQAIEGIDIEGLNYVAQRVQRMDNSVSDLRGMSNRVVSVFDQLYDLEARVPLIGSVSAMDVVRESFPAVGEAEDRIRSLDSELNALGSNAASLSGASRQISNADPASVSGREMEVLFAHTSAAASELESAAGSVQESVTQVGDSVGDLAIALRAGSDTPLIGNTLGGFALQAEQFHSQLFGLASLLGGLESDLGTLGQNLEGALESAEDTLEADLERWLAEPYDAQWPPPGAEPALGEQQAAAPAVGAQRDRGPQEASRAALESQHISLQWETSASSVAAGEGFTLTVRMYDVQQAGEHGGISASFHTLTELGNSTGRYSSD